MKSPYWRWVETKGRGFEPVGNNPDRIKLSDEVPESTDYAGSFTKWLRGGGVKSLSPRQQKVFQLLFVERKTQDEVSRLLQVSQSAVSQLKHTIQKRIAKEINLQV